MHWVLQTNLFKESEWENLIHALYRLNVPYSIHKVVPFIGELIPPAEPRHKNVICFGSYSMRHTAKAMGWTPGVYDLFDINFLVQKEHWGKELLNHDAQVISFRDAILEHPTFIRPIDDSKYFAGRIFDPDEWNTWRKSIVEDHHDYGSGLSPDTLVQLCAPKQIYAEYRFWIVDGKVVTWSQYKRGARVVYSADVDREVIRYASAVGCANTLAARNPLPWLPAAFVLDVCETPDGFKIVEINTINSAGFYACDVMTLVNELEMIGNRSGAIPTEPYRVERSAERHVYHIKPDNK
jgi:ATP-grasp domain, R2K clade family 3